MARLTQDARQKAADAAKAQGFSPEAGEAMLSALIASGGRQAQFNHPEFGGMGQWSGGMTQIGDMFNSALKARVEALAADLSSLAAKGDALTEGDGGTGDSEGSGHGPSSDWPKDLGTPSSTGSQNDMAYAVFPGSRRLAVRQNGKVTVYDTGDHHIGGAQQAQGGRQTLAFSTQNGEVRLEDLKQV